MRVWILLGHTVLISVFVRNFFRECCDYDLFLKNCDFILSKTFVAKTAEKPGLRSRNNSRKIQKYVHIKIPKLADSNI